MPFSTWPSAAWLYGAFSLNSQRTKALALAGLTSRAIDAPGCSAQMPQSTACGIVIDVGFEVGGKLVTEAVCRDSVLVFRPQAVCQAAYLHREVDGTADLCKHVGFFLGAEQLVDDANQGMRVVCVVADRPQRLALCRLDLCPAYLEVDHVFSRSFILASPDLYAIGQFAGTASSEGQDDQGKQIPPTCSTFAKGGTPVRW